ncbi:Transcription factor [Schizosaccharomyces pombe]
MLENSTAVHGVRLSDSPEDPFLRKRLASNTQLNQKKIRFTENENDLSPERAQKEPVSIPHGRYTWSTSPDTDSSHLPSTPPTVDIPFHHPHTIHSPTFTLSVSPDSQSSSATHQNDYISSPHADFSFSPPASKIQSHEPLNDMAAVHPLRPSHVSGPLSPPEPKAASVDHSINPAYNASFRLPDGPLWTEGSENLPSLDIQLQLAHIYFIYAHGQPYVLFHRDSFMEALKSQRLPPVLVLAMCAVAIRFWQTDKYDKNELFEQWFNRASAIAMANFDKLDLVYVASFVMLSYVCVATSKYWMFAGMAIRMVVALHPNKTPDLPYYDRPDSPLPFEIRVQLTRRLFWDCFMLDRLNSLYCNTQFLNLEDIHVPLPMRETLFMYKAHAVTETLTGKPSSPDSFTNANPTTAPIVSRNAQDNMGMLAYMIRMVSIWGRVVRCLKSYSQKQSNPYPFWHAKSAFNQLDQELYEWEKNLPNRLRYSRQTLLSYHMMGQGGQFACLHLIFLQIHLYVHRYAASISSVPFSHVKSPPTVFENQSAVLASQCANAICRIIQDCTELSISLAAPFTASSAYLAGTVLLYHYITRGSEVQASKAAVHLPIAKRHLAQLSVYWPALGMYAKALDAIAFHQGALVTPSVPPVIATVSKTNTTNTGVQQRGNVGVTTTGSILTQSSPALPVQPVPLAYSKPAPTTKSSLTELAYNTNVSLPPRSPGTGSLAAGNLPNEKAPSLMTMVNGGPVPGDIGEASIPVVQNLQPSTAHVDPESDLGRVIKICDWYQSPSSDVLLSKPLQLNSSEEMEQQCIDLSRHNTLLNLSSYGI